MEVPASPQVMPMLLCGSALYLAASSRGPSEIYFRAWSREGRLLGMGMVGTVLTCVSGTKSLARGRRVLAVLGLIVLWTDGMVLDGISESCLCTDVESVRSQLPMAEGKSA